MSDPYLYPGTAILKNKLNIRELDKLNNVERILTGRRLLELMEKPITGNFDLGHLQAIHKHIFQDLFDWDGQIRTVDISKGNFFARHSVISTYFKESVTAPLRAEGYLKNEKNKEQLSVRLAYYFDHVNAAHPFREGNGRTQREFFRTLALMNGFKLEWTVVSEEEMIQGSIKSLVHCDLIEIEKLMLKAIQNDTPDMHLIHYYKSLKSRN
ncbi:cell filamentation protein Fic [Bacillus canaveralius]|uniref:protein adenylyltransferase n=1 Tax=Bacillus canaveralius TaxID=1403243 RepID=A0A2N5GP98_9BACI|nr:MULTISPECIES: Fic family protein [Bacillus]PLR84395.1 cell filamentation protein Fic [Bacillus canaveralius]PLR87021.1 cell filamentation protein Fic [Bacillus sp. V33-4]PLS00603.1 cell filamentation protein Fic [Bacillus canaveralius]